MTQHVARIR